MGISMEHSFTTIGKIGLEGLMDRANIAFTSGYRFQGNINVILLQQSIETVCQCIDKFSFQVNFISQDNYAWQQAETPIFSLHTLQSNNLEEAFTQVCQHSHKTFEAQNYVPMFFTLILGTNPSEENEFIIAQTSCHTHVDARSSEVIFNNIIDYYNALYKQSNTEKEGIIAATQQLKTVDSDIVIKQRFEMNSTANHEKNIEGITDYSIEDLGQHAIAMTALDKLLPKYKQTERSPITQHFDVHSLLTTIRHEYSNVTKNSVACACIVKALYHINVQQKGLAADHQISFKMLSDILTPAMRQQYTGNYIAFVPVTVNAGNSIAEIANEINDRIIEFKTNNIDVSVFALTEDAISQGLVGTADESLSFVVTNWNNFTFNNQEDYLADCTSIRHQSGVNIEPKDNLGAALVNRPVFVINFSPNDELCISQFPSLDSAKVNQNIAIQLDHVFLNAGK